MAAQWSCYTNAKTDEFSFRWTIADFHVTAADEANPLESPIFDVRTTDQYCVQWRLRLRCTPAAENISLALVQVGTQVQRGVGRVAPQVRQALPVRVTFSLLDKDGRKAHTKEQQMTRNSEVGCDDFISKKTLLESETLLHKDCLKVLCEVTVKRGVVHTPVRRTEQYYPDPQNDLGVQLGAVLGGPDEGLYSDFTITAGGLQFKVHKLLLATRSPVFRAMIDSNMVEGESSCVKMEDHTPEVVKEMLTYIYTGQAPNIEEFVEELLSIAHKYQLESLVLECGKELRNRLTPENAIHTLCQAEKYGIEPLRSACLSFIEVHFSEVEISPRFATLKTESPEMYIDILEKALGSGDPPSAKRARMLSPYNI